MRVERPRIAPPWRVETVPGVGTFLLSENQHCLLRGRIYDVLFALLDGHRSTDEIVEAARGQASAAEIYFALGKLSKKGYVHEVSADDLADHEFVYWSQLGLDPKLASERLASATIDLHLLGDFDGAAWRTALGLHRLQVVGPHAGGNNACSVVQPTLVLVVSPDLLHPDLEEINRVMFECRQAWMLARPVGREMVLGPLFLPGDSPCWECLAHRQWSNRDVERFLRERLGTYSPEKTIRAATPGTLALAAAQVSAWIAHWIAAGRPPAAAGTLRTTNAVSGETRTHQIVRRPECPACGDHQLYRQSLARPIIFSNRTDAIFVQGGHRTVSPEQTLKNYEHHVSPLTGMLNLLERVPVPEGSPLHVYVAGDNWAVRHSSVVTLRWNLRSRSSGKGETDLQARVSGLCEALERCSAVYRGDESTEQASFNSLGDRAIHPNRLTLFSDRQYADRKRWNESGSAFNFIPEPFDADAILDWTPVWSVTHREFRLLPTACCYFATPQDTEMCVSSSNGNAAGNTLEEAALQGLLELIERDAVALWWYNRLSRPEVDLQSFDDPFLNRVVEFLAGRGREMWVLDVTSDLAVPTFVALSRRTSRPERIMLGFGCHTHAKTALLRTVTELNQMLSWILPGDIGESTYTIDDLETLDWLEQATLSRHPYLAPDPASRSKQMCDYNADVTPNLLETLRQLQSRLETRGLELLILNLTRHDIGLPVVRVMVPGLRPFWARYAPGRLYEVPVHMGWQSIPLAESELNPTPLFL